MRIFILILFSFSFLSCVDKVKAHKTTVSARWQTLKDKFPRQNLDTFALDSALYKQYKTYYKIDNNLLDSTISNQWGNIYLYSWQQRDTSFLEFTAIIQEEGRGTRIIYYVFSKTDSMLSATPVAWQNVEPPYFFDTRSGFTAENTLSLYRSQSIVLDIKKMSRLTKTKGDTTFVEILFKKVVKLKREK